MKNLKKVLLIGSLTIATLIAISASSNAATVKVTGEVVNVRKEATTSSNIVTSVNKNMGVKVIAKEGDWYKVETSDGNGYIKAEYLSKTK